uniref:lysine N(6)-hydroxylase/L-ornithine N(5)-oxygenase family protein n=1 Tax=Stappia sp. TaxID=1870903 RepID=UPI003BABBB2B
MFAASYDHDHDLVGIGFGPSHLAIAVAAQEMEAEGAYSGAQPVFLEKRREVVWHPDMLLPDSKLQVNFLKDLALMRNPQSRFTFLSYLFEQKRLHEFINLRTFFPSRQEFSDYYLWVAKFFGRQVAYGVEVDAIEPVEGKDGIVRTLRLVGHEVETGKPLAWRARNVSVGLGGKPVMPAGIRESGCGRIVHSARTRGAVERNCPSTEGRYRILVVGAGQTAGDVFQYAINAYPEAEVAVAHRGFAFKPQDDTHFVNEIFFPEAVDMFYRASPEMRETLLRHHADVTHSAVDFDLLPVLYDALYQDRATGRNRLSVQRFTEALAARESDGQAIVTLRDMLSGETREHACDVVIFATGYRYPMPEPLLEGIAPYLRTDAEGRYVFARDYHIERREDFLPKVYMQGYCEHTHGLSEILLSLMPIRAEEILRDLDGGDASVALEVEAAARTHGRVSTAV